MRSLGFTTQERRMVLFLVVMLALGSVVNLYRRHQGHPLDHPAAMAKRDSLRSAFVELSKRADSSAQSVAQEAVAELPHSRLYSNDASETELGDHQISLNSASEQELAQIPGIGPVLARRIVEYRGQVGRFETIESIKQVKGIGDKLLEKMRPYIRLE